MDLIDFLSKEFSLRVKSSAPKNISDKKSNNRPYAKRLGRKDFDRGLVYENISALLNDALDCLPNEKKPALTGDFDENSSRNWHASHCVAAKDLKTVPRKDLPSINTPLALVPFQGKAMPSTSVAWRYGLGGSVAVSVFLVYFLASYAPEKLASYEKFIDQSFFGFIEKKSDLAAGFEPSFTKSLSITPAEMAAAKAAFIMKEQTRLGIDTEISVSEEDLFGMIAGEMDVNAAYSTDVMMKNTPLPPAPPALPRKPESLAEQISGECVKFVQKMKNGQSGLVQKFQDCLADWIK